MPFSDSIPVWLRAPRNSLWLVIAVVLLGVIAIVSPAQLPVALYKASLIALAAVLGYWLDRALFPYARPDGYLEREWRKRTPSASDGEVDFPVVAAYGSIFCASMTRRAVVVGAVVIGVALGL